MKLCKCGCGMQVSRATMTCAKRGRVKGEYLDYIQHHHLKNKPKGIESKLWKGGVSVDKKGYIKIYDPKRSGPSRQTQLSRAIVEKIIGIRLKPNAVVHHVDHNKSNNNQSNLVVCESIGYHNLLHKRENAIKSGCNPNWQRCYVCKKYDEPKNLKIFYDKYGKVKNAYHKECSHQRYLNSKAVENGAEIDDP